MKEHNSCAIYAALGEPLRLAIVDMLIGKEICVCEIVAALGKSQPAVSHHLRILRECGLLRERRDGKWMMYSINSTIATSLLHDIQRIAKITEVVCCEPCAK